MEKAREFQRNLYCCFIGYTKAFNCVDHNILWKILKEMGIPDHLTCLLRNLYVSQKVAVRTGHEATDWFKTEKGIYIKTIYHHSAYLTYMQSTSFKMSGCMKHKLESRLPGEISVTSNNLRSADDTTFMAESEELKSLLMKVKKEHANVHLKLNIQKTRIMASGPITSWQIDGETIKTVTDFIYLFWSPKSLHMVIAAMELKDACSLEEKL